MSFGNDVGLPSYIGSFFTVFTACPVKKIRGPEMTRTDCKDSDQTTLLKSLEWPVSQNGTLFLNVTPCLSAFLSSLSFSRIE